MTRDADVNNAAVPPPRPSTAGQPLQTLRDSLIAQYGAAVGEALHDIEVAKRRKDAERLRGLRDQLRSINQQLEAGIAEHQRALVPYEQTMDRAYQAYLSACESLDAARLAGEAKLAPLRNQAAELIKTISAPPAHFSTMVKNWEPVGDPEPARPAMPEGPGRPR